MRLNKSIACDRTETVNGQEMESRDTGDLLLPLLAAETHREEGGLGDAVGLFKTPYLYEGHLSLRPVTMATGPAQCRGEEGREGGRRGADTMATQAVTATALMKAEGRALPVLKKQEPLHKLMTCYSLVIQGPLASFI